MPQLKKLLIVDDNIINRKILCKILESQYETIQASDGQEALNLLKHNREDIAVILLDLVMPVMNGYEFLEQIHKDPLLSGIPVVVTTGKNSAEDEIRCLSSGATDFVTKPFNPEIVQHRVAIIIRLREHAAMLKLLKNDTLTGVYSKEYFYQKVEWALEEHPGKEYDIICSDVENFKLINERFGTAAGDKLLIFVANQMKLLVNEELCGRLASNTFAILIERSGDEARRVYFKQLEELFQYDAIRNTVIKFGVYQISDRTIPVSAMCDRAVLAIQSIKHKYGQTVSVYDDSLRLQLLREQQIIDSMEPSLAKKHFVIYLQPKHELTTNRVAGAEALVRWIHPEFGFLPPGAFIPLFEKNGFITRLDAFVWEEVCKILSSWQESGRPMIPVSVNVSRADFNMENLPDYFEDLTTRYGIDPQYLHLEVTESAYTDDPQQIIEVVEELRRRHFRIEMDDFGSGYSSLNMLSELPIDILKLDMRFMQKKQNEGAANKKSILSFIISLSKWLELPTVAEGVETEQEAEMLKAMGCNYVQGYFFAKPMPVLDFEEYLDQNETKAEPEESSIGDLTLRTRRGGQSRVLVVDHPSVNRDELCQMLEPYYQVVTADDGRKALQYLAEHSGTVALMLLALLMPEMDGFQVLEEIKKKEEYRAMPILLTPVTGTLDEEQAWKLGASGLIEQPFRKTVLLHRMQCALDCAELNSWKQEQKRGTIPKLAVSRYPT